MNLPDLPDGFLDLAATGLLELLLLRGYPLWVLEDPATVAGIVAADESFGGFRKYPVSILESVREVTRADVNRLVVAETLRDEP